MLSGSTVTVEERDEELELEMYNELSDDTEELLKLIELDVISELTKETLVLLEETAV